MTTVAARFGRAEGISAMDNLGHSIKLGFSPLPHHLGIASFGYHIIWVSHHLVSFRSVV